MGYTASIVKYFISINSSLNWLSNYVHTMGIDTASWRQRIAQKGKFVRSRSGNKCLYAFMRINIAAQGCSSFRACAAMSLLLFMAGIELNPGPVTCAELANLITNLAGQLNAGFQLTNNKLDAFVTEMADFKVKVTNLELSHTTEIAALKGSLAQVTNELNDIKASITSSAMHWPTLQSSTPTPGTRSTINDLAAELKLRESKKLNIIVHGMPASLDDSGSFCDLTDKELGLKPHVQSVKRLVGKTTTASTKPAPLLVILRDVEDRRALLKNASKLRDSTDSVTQLSIFINPDLTQIERQEGFALRSELRRRKAAGEVGIGIRKGAIVKLPVPAATLRT